MLRVVFLFAMFWIQSAAAEEVWTTFTDTSNIRDIASCGDYVWCATSGGAVRMNRNDGSYRVFYREDGLADNNVHAVAADSTGTVWFGTDRGLSRFDGKIWKTWNTQNGLVDSTISDVGIDSSGNVWITANGQGNDGRQPFNYEILQSFDGKTWVTHISKKDYMESGFSALILDNAHKWVWIQGYHAGRYDIGKKQTEYYSPDGVIPDTIPCAIDSLGTAWFIKDGNPVTFDGAKWEACAPPDSSLAGRIRSMFIDRDGRKWFCTDLGLVSSDGLKMTYYKPDHFPGENPTRIYSSDGDGNLWGISSEGVSRFGDGRFGRFNTDIKLPGNSVLSIAVDLNNAKWFGLEGGGVSSFDGTTWKLYSKNDVLVDNHINDIAIDKNNVKWFGAEGGVSRFDGKEWKTYTKEAGDIADNNVSTLAIDDNNVLWVGMYSGDVASFDGNSWKNHPGCGKWIKDMIFDHEGNLWVATSGEYLWKWNGKVWAQMKYIPSQNLCSLAVDHEGTVWAGSENGKVFSMKDGVPGAIVPLPDAIGISLITSISEDKNGILWFTFQPMSGIGGGVAAYDRKSWTMYTSFSSGLVSIHCRCGAVDQNNVKWFGTKFGVSTLLENPLDRYIRVLAPSGGEQWDAGTVRRIIWQSKGVESLRIEYSSDSGGKWNTIASGIAASLGYYDWICFEAGSPRSRIRLVSESSSGIYGVSQSDFSILPPVYTTDKGIWTFFPYPPSKDVSARNDYPQRIEFTALGTDHSGAIWAGAFGGQVYRFSQGTWTLFPGSVTGFSSLVRALYIDRNNNIWFASGNGVTCYNGATWKKYEFWQVQTVYDIAEDRDGVLWLPGKGGIIQLNPDGSSKAHMFGELKLPSALSVAIDRNNVKWFGLYETATDKGDIASFDGNEWKTWYDEKEPIRIYWGQPIHHIAVEYDNTLRLATEKEVYSFSNGEFVKIRQNDYICDIASGGDGGVWIIERDATIIQDQVSEVDLIRWERQVNPVSFPGNKSFFDHFSRIAWDGRKALWFAADYGLWRFEIDAKPTAVEQVVPATMDLHNYPNPFNSSTTITFSLPASEKGDLNIYAITGQKVRTLVSGQLNAGTQRVIWDGRNDQGNPVATGMFFARFRAGEHIAARKMLLLR